jgi:hypothetical protein
MKTATPNTPTAEDALKAKNEAVKTAFFAMLLEIKQLIKLFPSDYLRTFLEVDYSATGFSNNYGFYSPLVHLRFEGHTGECTIYFAKNFSFKNQVGYYLDSVLTRCVFKHTSALNTEINIEDALNVGTFKVEDYREAKALLDKGFKGCQKATV